MFYLYIRVSWVQVGKRWPRRCVSFPFSLANNHNTHWHAVFSRLFLAFLCILTHTQTQTQTQWWLCVARDIWERSMKGVFLFCSVFYLLSPDEVNGITSRRHKHDLKGINYAYLSWVSLYECKQYPSSHFKMSVDVSVKTQSKVLVNKEIIWQTDCCVSFPFTTTSFNGGASWKKKSENGGSLELILLYWGENRFSFLLTLSY